MDRGARWATVHGVTKSQIQSSHFHLTGQLSLCAPATEPTYPSAHAPQREAPAMRSPLATTREGHASNKDPKETKIFKYKKRKLLSTSPCLTKAPVK